MSEKKPTSIKYAAVEVIRNGALSANSIECGALMGICRKKDDKQNELQFLVIANTGSSLRLYNLDEYKIVTLDILDDEIRYMTVFTDTDDDQKASIDMIDEVVEQMNNSDRLMENDARNELIDVETYVELPDAVLECNNFSGKPSTTTKITNTKTTIDNTVTKSGYNSTAGTNTTTYNRTPTLMRIGRKGKLPAPDRLQAMKVKVMQLATGVFEMPTLPIPKCDLELKTDDKKNSMIV